MPILVPLSSFGARQQLRFRLSDRFASGTWEKVIPDIFARLKAPGDHLSMLQAENTRQWAADLHSLLERLPRG